MKLKHSLVAGAMLMAAALAGPASAALTLGDILQIQYNFSTLGAVVEDNGPFAYTGSGQTVLTQFGESSVILGDNQVTFAEVPGCGDGCTQAGGDFNGPILLDLTNAHAFDGWTVFSDTVGITSFVNTGGSLGVNWQNVPVQGEVVVGAGVPEPATWALMVLGAGLAGAGLRRARRQAGAVATA
jgi:hypothetical protein